MTHYQAQPNVSADLIWEVARNNNAFMVKRKSAGGVQFSRDLFNVKNMNTRKHAGFVNDKAISVQGSDKGGIVMTTKKPTQQNRPYMQNHEISLHGGKSGAKVYKILATHVAKQGYRADILPDTIARASQIKAAARPKREQPEKSSRGAKNKK